MKKRKEDLKNLFDMINKYSLEMNRMIHHDICKRKHLWRNKYYWRKKCFHFKQSLVERLVESLRLKETQSLLIELINNLIN